MPKIVPKIGPQKSIEKKVQKLRGRPSKKKTPSMIFFLITTCKTRGNLKKHLHLERHTMLGDLVADNKWGVLPPVWTPDKSEVTVERVIDYFQTPIQSRLIWSNKQKKNKF